MSNSSQQNNELSVVAIENQVERVLGSSKFLVADQLSRFLRYVVKETLAGREDQIKQYTIGVKALGRDSGFDPQADPMVRMQARRLRRALHRYFETDGVADPIRIEIPKGRYVPAFLPNNALPNNDPGNGPIDGPPSVSSESEASATVEQPQLLPDGPSIALVSFAYLGGGEDAYLATGLVEELVIALNRFPEFLVIGPLNRDRVQKRHLGPRDIGHEYKVRFVLDGTVRKHEQTIRVTARLADATNGHHLWGQTQDFSLEQTSIFELENEIASQVVATIAGNFGIIPRTMAKESMGRRADTLSDYEAILRFHHYARVLTEDSLAQAVAALEKTLERDPGHAQAAALLGDLLASTYHLGFEDSELVLAQAEKLGRRALALDAHLQSARFTMALIHFLRLQREPCLAEIEATLQLNPNHANYIAASGLLLTMMGEWERGLLFMRKAERLNPYHPGWYCLVPFMEHYRLADYEAALDEARRFNTHEYFWDPLIRAAVLGQLGRRSEANEAKDELIALVPDFGRRGRSLIRRMVFLDENVDMLLDGLRKAGVDVQEEVYS